MSYRTKNVVPKKSSTSKVSKASASSVQKKSSRSSPKAVANYQGYRRSEKSTGARQRDADKTTIMYKPGPTMAIMPREYITKLRTAYSGIIPVAAFGAAPSGGLTLPITMCVNDVTKPFGSGNYASLMPAYYGWSNPIVASQPTWMGYGAAQTPTTNGSNSVTQLLNTSIYASCLVMASALSIALTSSDTAQDDDIVCTITPSVVLSATAPVSGQPGSVETALNQPNTVHKLFRPFGTEATTLTQYVDWAEYLGYTKEEYNNDVTDEYANNISGTTPYAINPPVFRLFFVININLIDLAPPSQPIAFTVHLDQYVKFYNYSFNNQAP